MEQTESNMPTTPSQNRLFTSKNLLPLSICAAVLIILSIVGTYMVLKSKVQNPAVNEGVSPTQIMTSPTMPQDEMASWKTFSNPNKNYTFKYPSNWSIEESDYLNYTLISDPTKSFETFISQGGPYPIGFGGPVKSTSQNLTLQIDGKTYEVSETTVENSQTYFTFQLEPSSQNTYILMRTKSLSDPNSKPNPLTTYQNEKSTLFKIFSTFTFLDKQTQSQNDWLVYEHKGFPDAGFEGTKGFKLYYPSTWKIAENIRRDEHPPGLQFKLVKNNSEITIIQGAGDASGCLYPEDPVKDGMYSQYGKYKQIKKGDYVWRYASLKDSEGTFGTCQKDESGDFVGHTAIGWINFKVEANNVQDIAEVDEILQKIEILP